MSQLPVDDSGSGVLSGPVTPCSSRATCSTDRGYLPPRPLQWRVISVEVLADRP